MSKQNALRGLMAALLIACGSAGASGLQVAPVGLEFAPGSTAQGVWLTNTGNDVLRAQVRVFHWTQADGKDVLSATQSLIASPPMLNLQPGGRQLVRVIRAGVPANGASEDAFRLLIDELPQPEQEKSSSVRYILRYSVPAFVETTGSMDAAPALSWSLSRTGDGFALEARNTGTKHAQLSDLVLQPPGGKAIALSNGLLGYVLPGSTMRWPLKVPAAQLGNGTLLKVMVNGKPVEQTLPGNDLPR
ncbi:MAG TPA: molecular chaperone [Rhodanobacteraceae bacterium]|nr:molecular chaperone [Rhodanobacteraceae bacterium]